MFLKSALMSGSLTASLLLLLVGSFLGCSKTDSFKKLEESKALLAGVSDSLEILSWSPEGESLTIPAKGSLILGLTLRYSGQERIAYRYLLDGIELGKGPDAFFVLKGSQMGNSRSIFTIEANVGISKASHDFNVVKNKLPALLSQAPSESLVPVDCTQTSKIFSAEFRDPEDTPLEFNWYLDGSAIDDTILTEVKGARARAVVSYDCTKSLDRTLTIVASDGIDEETVSWRYVKQENADSGTVGNSAIAFNPVSYDFGPLSVYSDSSTTPIAVTNTASKPLYLTGFSGANNHFTVSSTTCPISPSPWTSGANCTVNVKFAPQSPGPLAMSLTANYKADVEGSNLISTMGLTGIGVSPINFTGLSSITNVRHNKMTLNWPTTAGAKSFIVFRVDGANLIYLSTVVNTNSSINSTTLAGLTPSTSYTFRVRATDNFGNQDTNTTDLTRTTVANSAPAVTVANAASYFFYSGTTVGPLDANDANTATDVDSDDDALTYTCTYNNISAATGNLPCSSLVNEGGGNPSFNPATGVLSGWKPLHSQVGNSIRIDITGADPYSASSIYSITKTVLQGIPSTPIVAGISSSRAKTLTHIISGTADANGTVVLYYGANCATQLGQGSADGTGTYSISVTFPVTNGIYTVRAKGLNAIGNYSACSATSTNFTLDTAPPSPLTVSTTPTSPNGHLTPTLNITTEPNAVLDVYLAANCASLLSQTTANGSGAASLSLTVTPYSTTTYYVVASDDLGNATGCNAKTVSYTAYLGASGVGYFTGTQTTETGGFNGAYLSRLDAYSVKWSDSYYDSQYFSHSAGLPEDIDIETTGYYRISANMPLTLDNAGVGASGNAWVSTGARLYVNNGAHDYALTNSSLITNNDSQQESSANFSTIVYLQAGQTINLRTFAVSGDGLFCESYATPPSNPCLPDELVQITNGHVAQMTLEYLNNNGSDIFISRGSSTTDAGNPTNINLPVPSPIKWTETLISAANFTHSDSSNTQQVTIAAGGAGDYLAYVSIPIFSSAGTNIAPKMEIYKNGSPISTGSARQGFVLNSLTRYNSRSSSLHWTGLIPGLVANDIVTVYVGADAAAGSGTSIVSPSKAVLALQRISTGSKVFHAEATATSGSSGTWNPLSEANILWATQTYVDTAVFDHNTSTNSHQITLKQAGDYLIIYRDTLFLNCAVSGFSINPIVKLLRNGATVQGAQLKNHFIYNNVGNIPTGTNVLVTNAGHRRTSGAMAFYLRNVSANDVLSFTVMAESSFYSPAFTGTNNSNPCANKGNDCTYDSGTKIYTYLSSVTALNPATVTIIKK